MLILHAIHTLHHNIIAQYRGLQNLILQEMSYTRGLNDSSRSNQRHQPDLEEIAMVPNDPEVSPISSSLTGSYTNESNSESNEEIIVSSNDFEMSHT